jgi:predicted enzyme related to lactoylglutathione lyase
MVAWEDVQQVVKRIQESGGRMICFTKSVENGVTTYHQKDVTKQEQE